MVKGLQIQKCSQQNYAKANDVWSQTARSVLFLDLFLPQWQVSLSTMRFFLHFYTMIIQCIRIIVGEFKPQTSAAEVWCAANEPPHIIVINNTLIFLAQPPCTCFICLLSVCAVYRGLNWPRGQRAGGPQVCRDTRQGHLHGFPGTRKVLPFRIFLYRIRIW